MSAAKRAGIGGAAALVVVAVGVAALIGPYLRDDMRLDRIVRTVALDWRDFGLEKAQTRLQLELDRQNIGMEVGDDNCEFEGEAGTGERRVRCAWSVDVRVPVLGRSFPMSFESVATLTDGGDLR